MAIGTRGHARWQAGELAEAESDLHAALDSTAVDKLGMPPIVASMVLVLIDRGRSSEAQELMSQSGYEDALPPSENATPLFYARGLLRIVRGLRAEGLADLLALGARQAQRGTGHPEPPWRGVAALALLQESREDDACRLAEEYLEVARRWGAPRAIGIALRHSALVAQDDTTIPTLEESVAVLAGSYARLEHAYSLVELGAALRRANRRADARVPLREGLEMAHRCGAIVLAERAREELRATGARPRRSVPTDVDSLTASERRVAQLAAEGRTNREIAQDLFVTVNTVESHMRHVFQKLAITRRTELDAHGLAGKPGELQ